MSLSQIANIPGAKCGKAIATPHRAPGDAFATQAVDLERGDATVFVAGRRRRPSTIPSAELATARQRGRRDAHRIAVAGRSRTV